MDELLPSSVGGVPLHPLVVHFTVVLVLLAAVAVLLGAVLPRLRRWGGLLTVLLAGAALVLTPVTTSSGGTLQRAIGVQGEAATLVQRHADLGDMLLWWVVPLFLVAVATYVLGGRERRGSATPRWLSAALGVLAVVVAVGTIVQVYLVGHSGAEAVWGWVQT